MNDVIDFDELREKIEPVFRDMKNGVRKWLIILKI